MVLWGLYRLEEDEPRAATLIEAAAKQGHEEALATIGSWYLHGTVVEADPKIAVRISTRPTRWEILMLKCN